jgi:uncharacterized protein YqgC (DUF456 family)
MTLDIVLIILAFLLISAGVAGSFLPVLPGPPLAYAGLCVAHYTSYISFNTSTLVVYGVVVFIISIVDYFLPMFATRISGGTPQGARGAMWGTIAGMFIPIPFGIFIGAFVGAVLGEMNAGKTQRQALIAGLGAFAGFVAGSVMKFLCCLLMGFHLLVSLLF